MWSECIRYRLLLGRQRGGAARRQFDNGIGITNARRWRFVVCKGQLWVYTHLRSDGGRDRVLLGGEQLRTTGNRHEPRSGQLSPVGGQLQYHTRGYSND